MAETTVIVRVEDDLKAAFTKAAKAADRTASQLLRDFMRDYVKRQVEQAEYDAWLRRKVDVARQDVREGHVFSSDEVEAEFTERRRKALQRADESGL